MHGYVTSVGEDWYEIVRAVPQDELNLWRPGIQHHFRAVTAGEPVFLRLKAPHDRIVGFGLFAHFSIIPVSLAWRVYERGNGAPSFVSLKREVLHQKAHLRLEGIDEADPAFGAILLRDCVIFDEDEWIPPPLDLDDHAGHGKRYDLREGEGKRLWLSCVRQHPGLFDADGRNGLRLPTVGRYGPRSFQVAVFDAWGRRCAVTGEGVPIALRAARLATEIEGSYSMTNGILLRSDLSHLLEAGYLTITPDHVLLVSQIASSKETERDYHRWHGTGIRLPSDPTVQPDRELLWWHRKEVFLE